MVEGFLGRTWLWTFLIKWLLSNDIGHQVDKDQSFIWTQANKYPSAMRYIFDNWHGIFNSSLAAYAAPRWATFVKYGKVELTPPSPAEIPAAFGQLAGLVKSAMTMQFRHTTVKASLGMTGWLWWVGLDFNSSVNVIVQFCFCSTVETAYRVNVCPRRS